MNPTLYNKVWLVFALLLLLVGSLIYMKFWKCHKTMINNNDRQPSPPEPEISSNPRLAKTRGMRIFLLVVGGISLALGIIGIFLPIMPTTPFLLLTAACYVRSSERFYRWLVSHPVLSKYILSYLDGKGVPRKVKYYTTLPLWVSLIVSSVIVPIWQVRVLLILIGVSVTIYIWRLPELEL